MNHNVWGMDEEATRIYLESLNTQPRHVCEELTRYAGYANLVPPHHGSDGPIVTQRGSFVVHPSSSWTLAIEQEGIDVEFCPFCGDWLPVAPGVTDHVAGVIDNGEEALYDPSQKRPIEIEFVDGESFDTVAVWTARVLPGIGDNVMLPKKGDEFEREEWVVQSRYWIEDGGVYHVKLIMTTRKRLDNEAKRRMSQRRKPS